MEDEIYFKFHAIRRKNLQRYNASAYDYQKFAFNFLLILGDECLNDEDFNSEKKEFQIQTQKFLVSYMYQKKLILMKSDKFDKRVDKILKDGIIKGI
jgi:hypothetical protein